MDTIFEALRSDHDRQRELIDKLVDTTGDSEQRAALFEELRHEMDAHAAMEERWFYRPLMAADRTQDLARHSVAEHHELEEIVAELERYDRSGSAWLPTAERLRHDLLHHLEEEEREIFPQAGIVLDDTQKQSLATDYCEGMADRRSA